MDKSQEQNSSKENESKKKSLQSDDREVLKNREPPEDAAPISEAGKKRDDSERYQ